MPNPESKIAAATGLVNDSALSTMANGQPTWRLYGGDELEPLLEHTTVVCARWLLKVARGEVLYTDEKGVWLPAGVVPAWQQLSVEAEVRLDDLRASRWQSGLPIGVLSYGWASKSHPDPTGSQLRQLAPVLEVILKHCDEAPTDEDGESLGGINAPTFGIVWDYLALPQRGRTAGYNLEGDDRTTNQLARFRQGLGQINVWYGHKYTHTLVLNTPMPVGAENLTPYDRRGWCIFERMISSIVKHFLCYLELGKVEGYLEECRREGHEPRWALLNMACKAKRPLPMAPDAFEWMLLDKVAKEAAAPGSGIRFTSGKDLTDVVIPQYESGFLRLFGGTSELVYGELDWGDDDATTLAATLAYAVERRVATVAGLDLGSNAIGSRGVRALAPALAAMPLLETLTLGDNQIGPEGALALAEAVGTMPRLKELVLEENPLGDKGVAAFARLLEGGGAPELRTLDLRCTKGSKAEMRMLRACAEKRSIDCDISHDWSQTSCCSVV